VVCFISYTALLHSSGGGETAIFFRDLDIFALPLVEPDLNVCILIF
jgi:hypothetical protein